MATFAERLRELRKKKGVTLDDVQRDIGVTKATLSRYENGHREPSANVLLKLASYFNVKLDYLIGEDEQEEVITDVEQFADEIIDFFYKMGEITEEEKQSGKLPPEKREKLYKIFEATYEMYNKLYKKD